VYFRTGKTIGTGGAGSYAPGPWNYAGNAAGSTTFGCPAAGGLLGHTQCDCVIKLSNSYMAQAEIDRLLSLKAPRTAETSTGVNGPFWTDYEAFRCRYFKSFPMTT